MAELRHRKTGISIPSAQSDGTALAALPGSWIANRDERAVIIELICQRRLFGFCYRMLQPDYFDSMPHGSGVLLSPLVPTADLLGGVNKPGDIDLLIVPYEKDELVLERVMAVEFKTIRASFKRQSKSPNEYGFSQAEALLSLGFPYVTVAHMIVSDQSPPEHWREVNSAVILDSDGRLGEFSSVKIDMMPSDLMRRALGRLAANAPSATIGLLASYIRLQNAHVPTDLGSRTSIPEARCAALNPLSRTESLEAVARYLRKNPSKFVNTPRHDP